MKALIILSAALFTSLAALNVTGSYTTDFGILNLKQTKSNVSGEYSYPYNGEQVKGTLNGTLSNNTLNFNWEQKQGGGKAGGTGVFVFAKDGKAFTGTWKDSKGQTGSWNGKRK